MVSVILASYNGEKYIAEQIKSILSQSYSDFELIIADDCSSDNTYEIVKQFAQIDSRIHCTQNAINLGFKKNFEYLLSLAKGEYFAFSDQDDIWTSDHIELLVNIIKNKDAAFTNAELLQSNGNSLHFTLRDSDRIEYIPQENDRQFFSLLYRNFFHGSSCLISKKLLERALPIPNDIKYHDQWFGIVASLNKGIAYSSQITLLYRQHGDNVTTHEKALSLVKLKSIFLGDGNHQIYKEQLEFLQTFITWQNTHQYEKTSLIQEAILFYQNLLNKKQWKSFQFFLLHYIDIYCSKNTIDFLLRFFMIFILGK